MSVGATIQPGDPKPVIPTDKKAKNTLRFLSQPAMYMPNKHIEYPKLAEKKIHLD